jgi:hypothetical protein
MGAMIAWISLVAERLPPVTGDNHQQPKTPNNFGCCKLALWRSETDSTKSTA